MSKVKAAAVTIAEPIVMQKKVTIAFAQANWEVQKDFIISDAANLDLIKGTLLENLKRYVQAAKTMGAAPKRDKTTGKLFGKGIRLSEPFDIAFQVEGEQKFTTLDLPENAGFKERLKIGLTPERWLKFCINFSTAFELIVNEVREKHFTDHMVETATNALQTALDKAQKDKKSIPASILKAMQQPEQFAVAARLPVATLAAIDQHEARIAELRAEMIAAAEETKELATA
jgi:hypothetical protein